MPHERSTAPGATPGGRAASWFPVAWTASEAHAVPVRLTADYGRTVRFRVRVLPGGHYGDNTWEERGVLTGYDDDGGSQSPSKRPRSRSPSLLGRRKGKAA